MAEAQPSRPRRRRFYGGPKFGNPLRDINGEPRELLHRCLACGRVERVDVRREVDACECCGGVVPVVPPPVWLLVSLN